VEYKATHCQNLRSTPDKNGNPRRLWVIYDARQDPAFPFEIIDEGYGGKPEECKGLIQISPVNISSKEYKLWTKMHSRRT